MVWKWQQFNWTHLLASTLPEKGKQFPDCSYNLTVKLVHTMKTYIIQCRKLVIYRNHPHLFFSSKEEKNKHVSTIQCLNHWQKLSVSFNVPGHELREHSDGHEPPVVQTKRRAHAWGLCELKTRCLLTMCLKRRSLKNTQIFKGMKTLLFCCRFLVLGINFLHWEEGVVWLCKWKPRGRWLIRMPPLPQSSSVAPKPSSMNFVMVRKGKENDFKYSIPIKNWYQK